MGEDATRKEVAVVTGGGGGIGATAAERLSREGFALVVCDVDLDRANSVAKRIAGSGGSAIARSCDVSRRASVEAIFREVETLYGRIDALVTCAGITRDNLIHKMTDDDWDAVIDSHLRGTFLCAQAAQYLMVRQRHGKMVFISSPSARQGQRGQTNYSAAKAGIEAMARTLAIELGPFGINVNAVAPGFVDTQMTRAAAERMSVDFDDLKKQRAELSPLRRIADAEEIAATIYFLCGPESSYITGQTIYVRGGP